MRIALPIAPSPHWALDTGSKCILFAWWVLPLDGGTVSRPFFRACVVFFGRNWEGRPIKLGINLEHLYGDSFRTWAD